MCASRQKFEELYEDTRRRRRGSRDADDFAWLAAAAEVSWRKCEEYFRKVDDTAAYYAAISLNPTLKNEWYKQAWLDHYEKRDWINTAIDAVKGLWLEEYRGRYSSGPRSSLYSTSQIQGEREKAFTSARNHKRLRLKTSHRPEELLPVDMHDQYMETDILPLGEDESFDPMRFWNDRYSTQPDLARMALDALAVPAMSDECERLFSSAKLLLTDRRSHLRMDIVEACECLRAWYGPPPAKKLETFDEEATGQREIDQGVYGSNGIDGAHSSEPTSDWEDGVSYGNM